MNEEELNRLLSSRLKQDLTERLNEFDKRLAAIERFLNVADKKFPYECPVCKGMCNFSVFGKDTIAPCPACEGKGIVWN